MIGQPASSLQYVRYIVTTVQGKNPTTDTVQFGFVNSATNSPNTAPSSYVAGSWETDTVAGVTMYVARCLVGPGGTFVPAAGTTYWVWIKITDTPEVPVMQVGQLSIT